METRSIKDFLWLWFAVMFWPFYIPLVKLDWGDIFLLKDDYSIDCNRPTHWEEKDVDVK